MKVVCVGFMGVKLDFQNARFHEENNALIISSIVDKGVLALFPAGKWDCAINEERPDVTPETLEEQLKNERKRTEDIAMAASEGAMP